MRYSKQREAILRVLEGTDSHPTAEWIYDRVRREIPNISLGTVYRNLGQLAEHGLILELSGTDRVHYDARTGRHDHFRCLECGRIYDIDIPLDGEALAVPGEQNFQVASYAVELTGTCAACQSKSEGD
jgi:Fur family peroxide stress response transcriptional regulator